jgi:small ubiquitin-related modifier
MTDQNEDNNKANRILTIRVRDQASDETFFKVKKTTKMGKLIDAYAKRKGIDVTTIRFLVDGRRVERDDTPKTLELQDEDQIDCLLESVGGRSAA